MVPFFIMHVFLGSLSLKCSKVRAHLSTPSARHVFYPRVYSPFIISHHSCAP
jgi:hypothetical protein